MLTGPLTRRPVRGWLVTTPPCDGSTLPAHGQGSGGAAVLRVFHTRGGSTNRVKEKSSITFPGKECVCVPSGASAAPALVCDAQTRGCTMTRLTSHPVSATSDMLTLLGSRACFLQVSQEEESLRLGL